MNARLPPPIMHQRPYFIDSGKARPLGEALEEMARRLHAGPALREIRWIGEPRHKRLPTEAR